MLQGDTSDAERLLLRSARLDTPPPGGRGRALAALGLAAGAGTAAASSSAAASTMGASLIAKWIAAGALSGIVASTGVTLVAHRVEVARHPATPATAVAANIAEPVRAAPPGVESRVAVDNEPVLPAQPSVASRAPRRATEPESPPAPGLAAEIAALDAARGALAAGSASQTLALLDDYDARFRVRTFAQEAAVLRVEALHAAGRDQDAARLGERLLAAEPTSPHAQRLRSLLASLHARP
jgi:hypothetical protein